MSNATALSAGANEAANSRLQQAGTAWNRFWFCTADRRPLEVLRMISGGIALYLLATLLPDLAWYFGPQGVLPVSAMEQLEGSLRGPTYLDYFSSPTELMTVQVLGMLAVALFTVGWLTPLTAPLSLVVMLSTVHRAPMLTSLVEPVVTLVMFYYCLGPGGPLAWVASKFTQRPIGQHSVWANVALRLVQIHVAMLYGIMGLSKLMGETWWTGSGVWWLLARPESRLVDLTGLAGGDAAGTPLGLYLLNAWSHAIVAFELAFAILIWSRWFRPLLLAWSVVHWLGVALLLGQPLLAVAMIGANAAYWCDRR